MSTIHPNSNGIPAYEPKLVIKHLEDVIKDGNRLADLVHGMLAGFQLNNQANRTISESYVTHNTGAEKLLIEVAQNVEVFKTFEQSCKKTHELNSSRLSEITNKKKQLENTSLSSDKKKFTIDDFFYYLDGINTIDTANAEELKQEIDDVIKKDYDLLFAHVQKLESNLEKLLRSREKPDVDEEGDEFYSLEEDENHSIVEQAVELFKEQMKENLKNPTFKESLKTELFRQHLITTTKTKNIDREALSTKIDEEILTSPVTAILRYGLFKIKAEEAAQNLQDVTSFNAALNAIEESEGPRILEEVKELIPDEDDELVDIAAIIFTDLKSKERHVSNVVKTLREAKASLPEKGTFARCLETIRGTFGGTPHILTSKEMASKHPINSEKHYGDGLRLARLFYLGNIEQNIQMGVRLLQKVREELLKNPTKEKLKLLQDISVLYAQIRSNGNFIESLKLEINNSLYLTSLMGENLPSENLSNEMLRLKGLIDQTSLFFKTYKGISNASPVISILSYITGGPLVSSLATAFSIYANFRSIDHLKALSTSISDHQKKEILSAFINLDNLATSIEDLYQDQFNTKLYSLFLGENSLDSWVKSINHKFEKFSLELKYATTSEKIVGVAAAFFSPFIFAIDVVAFITIFTALGVVTAGAVLVAWREAMDLLASRVKKVYMLNEALSDLVNSIYSDTHNQVEVELKKRKFLEYWQQYLSPNIDKIIFDKSQIELKNILEGKKDTKIAQENRIYWEGWEKLNEEEKTKLRENYFEQIIKPEIIQIYKEVALHIYSNQKEVDFTDNSTKIKLLKELENLTEISSIQQQQIESFMMDWDIYNKDPTKAQEERKKLLLEKKLTDKVEQSGLSKENKDEALKILTSP